MGWIKSFDGPSDNNFEEALPVQAEVLEGEVEALEWEAGALEREVEALELEILDQSGRTTQ